MAKRAVPPKTMVSLKVTLCRIRPAIWRRLVVPVRMTLEDLHYAIQAAMGWHNDHLHLFTVAGRTYGSPDSDGCLDEADESRMTLAGVVRMGVNRFSYVYDFGDDWEHTVLIEKRAAAVTGTDNPFCVAGQRNCPPEDCGGVWGYEDLVAILANPADPRYDEMQEYYGDGFDSERFSLDSVNAGLAARFGG